MYGGRTFVGQRMWVIDKYRNRDKHSNKLSFASSETWFHLSESNSQIKSNMIQFLSANRAAIIPKANSRIIIRLFLYPPQSIYQHTLLLEPSTCSSLVNHRTGRLWKVDELFKINSSSTTGNPLFIGIQTTRGNLSKPCQFSQQGDQSWWRTC